ncbi:response regulator [Paenibacillus sp. MCAF20]
MNNVFSMVVVDDIPSVVNGITRNIPWSDYGIAVAGTAYNGLDGLKLIDEVNPDIIITDIRMPKLNGIEMIEQANQTGAKLIFISGYSDFNYAQQVVQLGGFDYILKPFTPEQLIDVVLKAKQVLEEANQTKRNLQDMERKLRESMPLLRQEYLNLLVQYKSHPEKVNERWAFLNVDMDERMFTVFAVEIDDYFASEGKTAINEVELLRFALQNILEETLTLYTRAVVFRDGMNRFICIVNARDEIDLLHIAEEGRGNIARYTRVTVSIGVGTIVENIYELPITYQQAVYALSYNFYSGGNSVFAYPQYAGESSTPIALSSEKEKELIYILRSGASDKIEFVLNEIFGEWNQIQPLPTPEKIRVFCIELMVTVRNAMLEDLENKDSLLLDRKMQEITFHTSTIIALKSIVTDICQMYCEHTRSKQKASANIVVNQSIAYIHENLHKNETVDEYARQVHLSTSYYSNLFKKVTGQSVLQYVVNERMEKAKLLILQGTPLQEVASAVGYEERSYFSDVFKKKTGLTPTEFRKSFQS